MRTKHTSHPLPSFPVYSCAFVSPTEFVLGGGGGQSKTGIKNKLVCVLTIILSSDNQCMGTRTSGSTMSKETQRLSLWTNLSWPAVKTRQ